MNLCPHNTLTFLFQSNGSNLCFRTHLFGSSMRVDVACGGRKRFNSDQVLRWLEECAKTMCDEWVVPFDVAWFVLHNALHTFTDTLGGAKGP